MERPPAGLGVVNAIATDRVSKDPTVNMTSLIAKQSRVKTVANALMASTATHAIALKDSPASIAKSTL